MGLLRYLLPVVASLTVSVSAFAAGGDNPVGEKDLSALRDYLNEKRLVTVNEKGGDLNISGDVRTRWNIREQKFMGKVVAGSGGPATTAPPPDNKGPKYAGNFFTEEVNLMLDYRAERVWSSVKIRFKNDMGIVDGTNNRVDTKRAYIGYKLWQEGPSYVDLRMGRMQMSDIFDSQIQFDSVYDGILAGYRTRFEEVGLFYTQGGVCVLDGLYGNYTWAGEIGLSQIADTGFYAKYSLIKWSVRGVARYTREAQEGNAGVVAYSGPPPSPPVKNNAGLRFINSQVTLGYVFDPKTFHIPLQTYGAFLLNTDAIGIKQTNYKKANTGWYVGATVGKLEQVGDWTIDGQYQYVEAQAIPNFDVSGIGRGPYAFNINSATKPGAFVLGGCNYKGFQFTGYVNLTNNLTAKVMWQQSVAVDKSGRPDGLLNGSNNYRQAELGLIYSW